jgi:hypothetical protein
MASYRLLFAAAGQPAFWLASAAALLKMKLALFSHLDKLNGVANLRQ